MPREPNRSKNADCGLTAATTRRQRLGGRQRELLQPVDRVGQAPGVQQAGVRVDARRTAARGRPSRRAAGARRRWRISVIGSPALAGLVDAPAGLGGVDPGRPPGTLVDERGVGLQQVGPGVQPLDGVLDGGDARRRRSASSSGPTRPRSSRITSVARVAQRWPGEPAGTGGLDLRSGDGEALAGDRGVGGDDPVQPERDGQVGHREHVLVARGRERSSPAAARARSVIVVGAAADGPQQRLEPLRRPAGRAGPGCSVRRR